MAIKVNAGFAVGAGVPIDERLVLTKAEMLAINESTMPDVYMACCKDDGKIYVFNKANTPNTDTGKFEELKTGGGSYTLPVATPTDLGGVMPDDVTIKADSAGVISAVDEVYVGNTPPTNGESIWIDTSEDYEGSKFGDIYSTNEVCIGTWIDGKPLYRKVFTCLMNSQANWAQISYQLPTNVNVVKYDGILNPDAEAVTIFDYRIGSYFSNGNEFHLYVVDDSGVPAWIGKTATITVEYIKA